MDSIPQASATALAYIAGYVDGEGCIYWHKTPCLALETCNPFPLRFIVSIFGGKVQTRKRTGLTQTRRTVHVLRYYGDTCLLILKMINPYLLEKKDQAEDLIQIRHLKEKLKNSKRKDHNP